MVREDAPEFQKKDVQRGSTLTVQERLEVETIGERGGNNPKERLLSGEEWSREREASLGERVVSRKRGSI